MCERKIADLPCHKSGTIFVLISPDPVIKPACSMFRKIPIEEVLDQYRSTSLHFRALANDREIKVKFSLKAFLYQQQSIVALWSDLNRLGFQPVAKTFLGRIRYIKIKYQ